MASKEAAKPSPLPPHPEMILEAIQGLGDKYGIHRAKIFKYIEGKYGKLPPADVHLVRVHLWCMRRDGKLISRNGSYFRADAPPRRKAMYPLEAAVKQATAGMPEPRGRPPKKARTDDSASPAPAPAPAPAPGGDGSAPVKSGRGRPPKEKTECWNLQHSKPEYLEQLAAAEMFHGVAVDATSCIAGQAQSVRDADGDEEGEDADGDGIDNNPMSTSSRKRRSSSTDTTTTPAKKSKAHLLNLMDVLIQELQSYRQEANQNLHQFRSNKAIKEKQEVDQQIDRCLRMAVECGATEESEEYFMATMLFEKEYNRKIFCKFSTAEGRFMWLKRWCQRSRG